MKIENNLEKELDDELKSILIDLDQFFQQKLDREIHEIIINPDKKYPQQIFGFLLNLKYPNNKRKQR